MKTEEHLEPGDLVRVLTDYTYGSKADTLAIVLPPPYDFKFYIPDDYVYIYVFKEHSKIWMMRHWLLKV